MVAINKHFHVLCFSKCIKKTKKKLHYFFWLFIENTVITGGDETKPSIFSQEQILRYKFVKFIENKCTTYPKKR